MKALRVFVESVLRLCHIFTGLCHEFNVKNVVVLSSPKSDQLQLVILKMQFPSRFGLPVNFQGMVVLPQKKQVMNYEIYLFINF